MRGLLFYLFFIFSIRSAAILTLGVLLLLLLPHSIVSHLADLARIQQPNMAWYTPAQQQAIRRMALDAVISIYKSLIDFYNRKSAENNESGKNSADGSAADLAGTSLLALFFGAGLPARSHE